MIVKKLWESKLVKFRNEYKFTLPDARERKEEKKSVRGRSSNFEQRREGNDCDFECGCVGLD